MSSDHTNNSPEFLVQPNPFYFQPSTDPIPPITSTSTQDTPTSITTSSNQLQPPQTITSPPSIIYSVNAFGVSDRTSDSSSDRSNLIGNSTGISHGVPGGGDCAKLCPRHQRMANEGTNRALQSEIEKLPQSDQEAINTAWGLFSASNSNRRRLILSGILTMCCPSQLSFLTDSISIACRTDPFIRLPKEISLKILRYFDAFSLGKAAQVSKLWKKLADDDLLWRSMCQQHIERTCQKCGWGLPSMEKIKKRGSPSNDHQHHEQHQSGSDLKRIKLGPSSSSSLTTDVSSSSNEMEIRNDVTKPWKSVYTERLALERNWRKGNYKEKVLLGHTDSITCLQISNSILMTGSWDKSIRIWNLDRFELIRTLNGHLRGVKCLQFDNNKLISGGMDRLLKIWNWRTGDCIRTIEGHSDGITCLNYDEELLASGSSDASIRIWNFKNGSGYILLGHLEQVNCLKLNKSQRLYSASDDNQIRIWDLVNRECLKVLNGHVAQITSISLIQTTHHHQHDSNHHHKNESNTGREESLKRESLISGSLDNCLKVWDLDSGKCQRTLFGHIQGVWSVDADRLRVVSGSHDRSLKIWDRLTGKCVHTLVGHRGAVTTIGLTDDKVISGGDDGEIRIWWFGCYDSTPTASSSVTTTVNSDTVTTGALTTDGTTSTDLST